MFDKLYFLASSLTENCDTGAKSIFSVVADWAVWLVDSVGALGIVIAVGLETIFPFIPSEVILPLIGATASTGGVNALLLDIFWSMVGVMIGAIVVYWLSRWFGLERMVKWLSKIPLISKHDIIAANDWFQKKGYWGVLIGRCVPVIRVLVSIPAGVGKMKFGLFCLFTFIGSFIWNSALILAGFLLGEQWCSLEEWMKPYTWLVVIICVILVVLFVILKIKHNKKTKEKYEGKELSEEFDTNKDTKTGSVAVKTKIKDKDFDNKTSK